MLVEKEYPTTVVSSNIEYYKQKFPNVKRGDIIFVFVRDLMPGSHVEVDVICDLCGKKIKRAYRDYLLKRKDFDMDVCCGCKGRRAKITTLSKYGVENISQLPEIKEKKRNKSIEKFGTNCVLQNDDIKEKIKTTVREKYGTDYVSQSEQIKEKVRQNSLLKYGCESPNSSEIVKQHKRESMMEKYGAEYFSQTEEYKKHRKQTAEERKRLIKKLTPEEREQLRMQKSMEKYGVPYPIQSEVVRAKIRKTFLEKYGCENPFCHKETREKAKQSVLEKYGVDNVFQSPQIKEKIKTTCMEKYGAEYAIASDKVREKITQGFLKMGNTYTFKPQMQIYDLLSEKYGKENVALNKNFRWYFLDVVVVVNGIIFDIEYDGAFYHQNQQRDAHRDNIIKKKYKILRIRGGHFVPSIEEIEEKINYMIQNNIDIDYIYMKDWIKFQDKIKEKR